MTTAKTRRGVTLVEIMAAILVLSIGLVGVLAAIPFGGVRLAQMSEADNSAAVGANALRIMETNDWANPNRWWIWEQSLNGSTGGVLGDNDKTNRTGIYEGTSKELLLNLQFPYVIDPYNAKLTSSAKYPYPFSNFFSVTGLNASFTYVSPLNQGTRCRPISVIPTDYLAMLEARYESVFFQQDDLVSGVTEDEDETVYRPQLEMEDSVWPDSNTTIPSYTGHYSWMACVYPRTLYPTIRSVPIDEITSSDYDVIVFKDRTYGEEIVMSAQLQNSGYQGGVVDVNVNDVDVKQLMNQLVTTRCIMLVGRDDFSCADDYKYYARWFKIANYGYVEANGGSYLRLTLVGSNMPRCWRPKALRPGEADEPVPFAAVFYPGAVGVYSGKSSFTDDAD